MEKREKRGDSEGEGGSVGRRLVGDVRFGAMAPKHITTDSAPHALYSSPLARRRSQGRPGYAA